MSFRRWWAVTRKEFLHIFRDPLSRQKDEQRGPHTESIETYIDPDYTAKKKGIWDTMTGWWK